MRRGWVLIAVLACAGCDGGGAGCASDEECAAGRHCALGECIAACSVDGDCASLGASAACDVSRGRCHAGMGPDAGREPCVSNADCDDGTFCNGAERCEPGAAGADAVGCVAGAAPCAAGESCDEAERACVVSECAAPDEDGDGHARIACGGDDCDDADANRFPGNPEVCDAGGHDEDCNAESFGFADLDSDGYVDRACCNDDGAGGTNCGTDCNDMRALSHPNHVEVCDTFDNDCDGAIDEEVVPTWYADADGDGFGDPDVSVTQCMAPVGHVASGADCDDAARDINPVAREDCDGVDNNCDGLVDAEDATVDDCACLEGETADCGVSSMGECRLGSRTCAADGRYGACEGNIDPRPEGCNALDDDCDGAVDEGVLTRCYRDDDGDGRGTPMDTTDVCGVCPGGYVLMGGDCNDARSDTYPGAIEICDRRDNNCSSGGGSDAAEDLDEDRHSPVGHPCSGGYPTDDCRDNHPLVFTGSNSYRTEPSCPLDTRWCEAGCCVAESAPCPAPGAPDSCLRLAGEPPLHTWDYNCTGTVEIQPMVSGMCELAGGPLPSCSGAGPLESATSCEADVSYRTCQAVPRFPSGYSCTASMDTRRPGCR